MIPSVPSSPISPKPGFTRTPIMLEYPKVYTPAEAAEAAGYALWLITHPEQLPDGKLPQKPEMALEVVGVGMPADWPACTTLQSPAGGSVLPGVAAQLGAQLMGYTMPYGGMLLAVSHTGKHEAPQVWFLGAHSTVHKVCPACADVAALIVAHRQLGLCIDAVSRMYDLDIDALAKAICELAMSELTGDALMERVRVVTACRKG